MSNTKHQDPHQKLFETMGAVLDKYPLKTVYEISLSLLIGTIQQIEPPTARAAITRQVIDYLQDELASINLELNP